MAKCAVCGKEMPVSKMKWCSNDQFWLCKNCVKYSMLGGAKCPKCQKPVK